MGVDYDAIGGIGIIVRDEMVDILIRAGRFGEDEWDNDPYECMEDLGIPFVKAGNGFVGGKDRFYWIMNEGRLPDIISNASIFLRKINLLSDEFNFGLGDLQVIEDLYVY